MLGKLISDLHIECGKLKMPKTELDKQTTLIIAGDVAEAGKPRLFIEQCCNQYERVIYIIGNHEYYCREYYQQQQYWKDLAVEIDNLYVLENDTVVFGDVRIIGATLWTSMNDDDVLAKMFTKRGMNDYRVIRIDENWKDNSTKKTSARFGRTLTPDDTVGFFNTTMEYFEKELAKPFDGTTIVATHHSPSFSLSQPEFIGSKLNPGFHSSCEHLMEKYKVDYWLFAHTHFSVCRNMYDSIVYSNQRGYNGYEHDPKFDLDFTFDTDKGREQWEDKLL